jgi:hypothetical protein
MRNASAIFMSCLIRRRRPERNSIITTLDVTASCLALRRIIQCPIWSRFGIRRPSIAPGNDVQACQIASNTICTYIGTRDLVQEHISYKVWPLENEWEMSKEAAESGFQHHTWFIFLIKYGLLKTNGLLSIFLARVAWFILSIPFGSETNLMSQMMIG